MINFNIIHIQKSIYKTLNDLRSSDKIYRHIHAHAHAHSSHSSILIERFQSEKYSIKKGTIHTIQPAHHGLKIHRTKTISPRHRRRRRRRQRRTSPYYIHTHTYTRIVKFCDTILWHDWLGFCQSVQRNSDLVNKRTRVYLRFGFQLANMYSMYTELIRWYFVYCSPHWTLFKFDLFCYQHGIRFDLLCLSSPSLLRHFLIQLIPFLYLIVAYSV